jgi:tetratricopeptide (TPR) repeat protein
MTLETFLASRKMVFALLLLATFVVFGNTFQNEWTYDDIPVVVDNPDIRSLENFSKDTYKGRPLRELSYMLDYKLFGDNPAGYRLQQNLWHAANGCLLFIVMSILGVAPGYALLGVLFFLFHPIQTESVASIGHRKELLPLFFCFLIVLAYAKSFTVSSAQRWLLWLGCFVSYGLVILGNVTAFSLPLVLPIYELLYVDKRQRFLTRYPALCWLVVISLAVVGGVLYTQKYDFQVALLKTYAANGSAGTKGYLPMLMVALKAPALYLGKIFYPVSLAPEYVVDYSGNLLQWGSVVGSFLLMCLATVFWLCRKTLPALSFATAWCCVLYLPVANLLPVYSYSMADRYLYMVLPGVGIGGAILLQTIGSRRLNYLFVAGLMVLSLLTIVQNSYWRDNYSLWSHAAAVNPESIGALWSLGKVHLRAGELTDAKRAFNKVLELDRFHVHSYLELAKIQELEGNHSEAKKNYEFFVRYGQYSFPAEAAKIKAYLRYKFR